MSAVADVRRVRIAALVAVTVASGGCGGGGPPAHPPTDVSGWYVRAAGDGREVIDVRPNSVYVHVVTIRGGATRADEGRWHAVGDSTLMLESYRDAADVGHGAPPSDSARAAIHPASDAELRLQLPGDSVSFLRRLRYGKQRGG